MSQRRHPSQNQSQSQNLSLSLSQIVMMQKLLQTLLVAEKSVSLSS